MGVYSDGDIAVEVRDQRGLIFEPAQIRKLQSALQQLHDTESSNRSLGKDRLDGEGRIRYDSPDVYISDRGDSKRVALSKKQATELKKALANLGY